MPDDFILPQGDIADMESVFKTLEEVAGEYDEDSNQRRAIELASKALLFAFTQQVQNSVAVHRCCVSSVRDVA